MPTASYPTLPAFKDGSSLFATQLQQVVHGLDVLSDSDVRHDPYACGIVDLKLFDNLGQGRLGVESCEAVLDDGTTVRIPTQDTCEPLAGLDRELRAGQVGHVWLTIGRRDQSSLIASAGDLGRRESTSLTASGVERETSRFREHKEPVRDHFEPQREPDEFHVLRRNFRLVLTRNDEKLNPKLACLKLAEIHVNPTPQLSLEYVPACLSVKPILSCYQLQRLHALLTEVLRNIDGNRSLLQAELAKLGTQLVDYPTVIKRQRLQALAAQYAVLLNLLRWSGTHPSMIYLELVRLIESLRTLHTEVVQDVPQYRHDALWETMNGTKQILYELLERRLIDDFEVAEMTVAPTEGKGRLWRFHFKNSALLSQGALYLGLSSLSDLADVTSNLKHVKIAGKDQAVSYANSGKLGLLIQTKPLSLTALPNRSWVNGKAFNIRVYNPEKLPDLGNRVIEEAGRATFREAWTAVVRHDTIEVYIKPDAAEIGLVPTYMVLQW